MPKLTNGEQKDCSACGVRFIAADTGKPNQAPIELAPHPEGNVLLQRQADRGVVAITFALVEANVLRSMGVELRMNHFATCPDAERFRPTTTEEQTA